MSSPQDILGAQFHDITGAVHAFAWNLPVSEAPEAVRGAYKYLSKNHKFVFTNLDALIVFIAHANHELESHENIDPDWLSRQVSMASSLIEKLAVGRGERPTRLEFEAAHNILEKYAAHFGKEAVGLYNRPAEPGVLDDRIVNGPVSDLDFWLVERKAEKRNGMTEAEYDAFIEEKRPQWLPKAIFEQLVEEGKRVPKNSEILPGAPCEADIDNIDRIAQGWRATFQEKLEGLVQKYMPVTAEDYREAADGYTDSAEVREENQALLTQAIKVLREVAKACGYKDFGKKTGKHT